MSSRPTQAVVLAGGRGTRLHPLSADLPKALVPFHGRPFLGHVADLLRAQGFERLTLLLGHQADRYLELVGSGHAWGLDVDWRVTAPDDLTSARVLDAADVLDDTFFLLYCDNLWPFRWDDVWRHHAEVGAPCQVVVYANRDGYTRDSVIVRDGRVAVFDRERTTPGLAGVEISYAILDRATVLPLLPRDRQELFEVAAYAPLAARGDLAAYWTEHRYYSVGNLTRLPLTHRFLAREPTVILDRDGVLNERAPRAQYVTTAEGFRWLPGALEALRRLRAAGWRTIVVSNQAGIARGRMTQRDLDEITGYMRYTALEAGGRIDAFYSCPHDWDAGCWCRKPNPGMLLQAQRDFDLDLTRTFFLGDDGRDAQAADAAGAQAALVSDDAPLLELVDRLLAGDLEDLLS